ncbi:cytochrome P450 [Gautieria morchelliformis]|nr:cytochrome P450 [Gautieria morchelliformis]
MDYTAFLPRPTTTPRYGNRSLHPPLIYHLPLSRSFVLILTYAVSGLAKLIVTQYFSHLGELNCPPVPSYFWGHLQLLHDAENTNLYMKWMEQLGPIFTYRGFIGGHRLVTMDTRAISHILSQPHEYPKPSFVRDTLSSMAGEQGLLVVEGEAHKRQRKILNPSFTASQVRELTPIFYDKASKLRDIWLDHIDSARTASKPKRHRPETSANRKLPPPLRSSACCSEPRRPSHKTLLSPATPTLPLTPPPRPDSPMFRLRQRFNTADSPSEGSTFALAQPHPPSRVDVLNWLGRATLDVIGLAGFGYTFDALVDDQNDLATAFAEVFSAARKFRFVTVLQAWFPILHYFHAKRNSIDRSLRTMHQIGTELIRNAHERLAHSGEAPTDFDFRERFEKSRLDSDGTLKGRDLLSLLIKSNIATADKERMSQNEILSQISTFMAAGHETTSSALTWTLYALSQHPACQSRLRAEISMLGTPTPTPETLNGLRYLDMVVRESLRLYSPVSQTMRVALKDDVVPVAVPYQDAKGKTRENIMIKKGDIISIPIQAMNKIKNVFGEDAENFILDLWSTRYRPERWERPPDPNAMPTLYSSILTFLYGGRACIGYRFALLEMKAFLFVLLRSISFENCPDIVIEKRLNVVTRPLVKSEPERGNQMPLLLSRVPQLVSAKTSPQQTVPTPSSLSDSD